METLNEDHLLLKASNLFIAGQIVSSHLLQRRLKITKSQAEELMYKLQLGGVINERHDDLTEEYKITYPTDYASSLIHNVRKPENNLINNIKQFIRTYWWLWLALFIISLTISIIGPSVVGNFTFRVFSFIFSAVIVFTIFYYIIEYTIGKSNIGIWGLLRVTGLIGFLFFTLMLLREFQNYHLDNLLWDSNLILIKHNFIILIALDSIALFFLAFGELLLYLHKINSRLDLSNNKTN